MTLHAVQVSKTTWSAMVRDERKVTHVGHYATSAAATRALKKIHPGVIVNVHSAY